MLYLTTAHLAVVALDATTGAERWKFDAYSERAEPCYPLASGGVNRGLAYWQDGEERRILFEIEEVPAPASDAPGERAWPTQPAPEAPPPFVRTSMDVNDLARLSEASHAAILARFQKLRSERFRAFDSASGAVLWQIQLPAGGAGKIGTRAGDAFVAFALA
ncbi:MAG: PQQ-binding-like beta-propeller repeat protein [bacterium]|nr:PQQ-binding-like beta-propeller repeat protein [bacterium]